MVTESTDSLKTLDLKEVLSLGLKAFMMQPAIQNTLGKLVVIDYTSGCYDVNRTQTEMHHAHCYHCPDIGCIGSYRI